MYINKYSAGVYSAGIQSAHNSQASTAPEKAVSPDDTTATELDSMLKDMEEQKARYRDIFERSKKEAEEKDPLIESLRKQIEGREANRLDMYNQKPIDKSKHLTNRLVSARGQFTVRQVIAEAGAEITSLSMIAATSKGDDAAHARACIRKLERLMSRAGRKIRDLDSEDILQIRKARAQQKRQEKKAEEIKEELKKKRTKRSLREFTYLQDKGSPVYGSPKLCRLDPASEARLEQEAMALAAAEIAAEVSVDIGGDIGVDVDISTPTADGGTGESVEADTNL